MTPDPTEDAAGTKTAAAGDVELDTSEVSRSAQKVELDLDDAPFLEEEEEVQPEPPKPKEAIPLADVEEVTAAPPGRKKHIIIGAAVLVALVAAALAAKLLFFKGKPAAPEQPAHAEQKAPEPAANATEAEKPEVQFRMDPFLVEQKAQGDEVRFLTVRILLGAHDEKVPKDFESKLMQARNDVFYYLKNKDVQFLTDENNTEKLKSELLLIINRYVADGKFDSLLFEEYVVK